MVTGWIISEIHLLFPDLALDMDLVDLALALLWMGSSGEVSLPEMLFSELREFLGTKAKVNMVLP